MANRRKRRNLTSPIDMKLDVLKEHLDRHMDLMGNRLDKIDGRVDSIDKTLASQNATLEEHVRRTNLLETKIEDDRKTHEDKLQKEKDSLLEKLEPLKTQSTQIKIMFRIGAALLGLAGVGSAGLGLKEIISAIIGG